MNQKSIVAMSCVFVILAGARLAQSGTVEHRGKQQDKQFLRVIAIADVTEAERPAAVQALQAAHPLDVAAEEAAYHR